VACRFAVDLCLFLKVCEEFQFLRCLEARIHRMDLGPCGLPEYTGKGGLKGAGGEVECKS
jgi:hypothetical protein